MERMPLKRGSGRIKRERKTLKAMIGIYCRDLHEAQEEICPVCRALQTYALKRIEKCPFREDKPTCARCTVHCYETTMRERIRKVMQYAGPRMLHRHPVLTFLHIMDGWRR